MDSSPDGSVSFSELADTLLQNWHITNQPEHVYDTPPGGALPYMGYIGMCCCEGYGFQAVYSSLEDRVYKSERLGLE